MVVDAHIHVVGDPARYPMITGRRYTPPAATIGEIEALGAPVGVNRFVLVQPSFYGTDNTLLLDTLAALGPRGAGVAVLDPATTGDGDALRLAASGIRGLRINLYSGHEAGPGLAERFTATAGLAKRMRAHVQVIADLPVLIEASELLARADVPVVIDHYGLPGRHQPDSESGKALLALMQLPHMWMKLSAPYRSTGDALGITPDPFWLAALLQTAPTRCVWGSDWPHTPAHEDQPGGALPADYRPLDYAELVRTFRQSLSDRPTANQAMHDNAMQLYGF